MELLTTMIKYFLLTWVLSGIIEQLSEFIPTKKLIPSILKLMLSCHKCTTFWTILILTQSIYVASLMSFIMFIYKKIEDKIFPTQL